MFSGLVIDFSQEKWISYPLLGNEYALNEINDEENKDNEKEKYKVSS